MQHSTLISTNEHTATMCTAEIERSRRPIEDGHLINERTPGVKSSSSDDGDEINANPTSSSSPDPPGAYLGPSVISRVLYS